VTLGQIRYIALQLKNGDDIIGAGKVLADLAPGPRAAPAPLACGLGTLDDILIADTGPEPTLICGATGGSYYRKAKATSMCASEPVFRLGLVEYAARASAPSRVLASYPTRCVGPLLMLQPLWSNRAGTAQLGLLSKAGRAALPQFGIFSKGKFTALPMPVTAGLAAFGPSPLNYIAW
jgi:hypothetical protein